MTQAEQKTKEYYELVHKPTQEKKFVDGESRVNYAGRVFDFWLTYGDYSWAFLVNSGSSANLLALTSPLLKDRGDEVITGFPTTVAPIVQYGAVPVFMDLTYANVDVTQLELALSPKTKAIMIAHSLGNPFNLRAVKEFCDKHNLWLIEDNCDALGSTYEGKPTGEI